MRIVYKFHNIWLRQTKVREQKPILKHIESVCRQTRVKLRRGPDPEIPGLKTQNPEVLNLNKLYPNIPKFEKKRIPVS